MDPYVNPHSDTFQLRRIADYLKSIDDSLKKLVEKSDESCQSKEPETQK